MKSLCEKMDQDLVLLVHGQLLGRLGVPVRAHLLTCARCRARKRQIESLTRSLATALRNPVLGTRSIGHGPGLVWASIGVGALVLLLGGLFVSSAVASQEVPPPANVSYPPISCPAHLHALPVPSSATKPNVAPAKPKIVPAQHVFVHCKLYQEK